MLESVVNIENIKMFFIIASGLYTCYFLKKKVSKQPEDKNKKKAINNMRQNFKKIDFTHGNSK